MYTDPTEPKDGDFAAYVERLTGGAARTPGQVQRTPKKTKVDARRATRKPSAAQAGPPSLWGRSAHDTGTAQPSPSANGATPPDLDVALRQLGSGLRSAGTKLSQWLLVAGGVALGLSLVGFWSLSLLPGIVLIGAAILLRSKLSKS